MKIAAAIFSITVIVTAQGKIDPEKSEPTVNLLYASSPILDRSISILPLSFVLNAPQVNTALPLYQSFVGVPQSFAWEQQRTVDLTAPLKLQLYRSETEKAVRITLGAVQLGGAAYLAYRYLKKNGLK